MNASSTAHPRAEPIAESAVIATRDLTRTFGPLTAVNKLSLEVQKGEIFGFLGPNGAGKTTTIKMLCGLLAPSGGEGRVVGCDIHRERAQIKRRTGYMAQSFSLYPDLTAAENFRFFAGVYGLFGKRAELRMGELFERVEIADRAGDQAGRLSGGLKQRLALACALVHKPELVFLDEPTAGVDPNQRQRLWDLLYDLCQEGTTLFVTTHYLDEAERCHNVGFMQDGRLIAHGHPNALRAMLDNRLIGLETKQPVPALRALKQVPGVDNVTLYGYELRIFLRAAEGLAREALFVKTCEAAGSKVERIYVLTPTLEDLFMSFTRGLVEVS